MRTSGIYTLSHNECVGECLTEESAEYYADLIAQEMAPKLAPKVATIKHTKAELLDWMNTQKRIYAEGSLSEDKIQKLESLPGWTWTQIAFL
jgi:hypothetical protein